MHPLRLDVLIAGFLGVWFALIAIYQIFLPNFARWTVRFDIFRLIPGFRLHTWVPSNVCLEYRDVTTAGPGAWRRIAGRGSSVWTTAIWNPCACVHLELNDCAKKISNLARTKTSDIGNRRAFSIVADYVASLPAAAPIEARQFRVLSSGSPDFESQPVAVR